MKTESILSFALAALCLAGCVVFEENGPPRAFITTRLQDIHPGTTPQRLDSFGPGETAAVYVHGYGGETVTLTVYDVSDGRMVKRDTQYIPEGKDNYWSFPDLPAGSYRTVLSIGTSLFNSAVFRVSK